MSWASQFYEDLTALHGKCAQFVPRPTESFICHVTVPRVDASSHSEVEISDDETAPQPTATDHNGVAPRGPYNTDQASVIRVAFTYIEGQNWQCCLKLPPHKQFKNDDPRRLGCKHKVVVKANHRSYSNLMVHLVNWHATVLEQLQQAIADGKNNEFLQGIVAANNEQVAQGAKVPPIMKAIDKMKDRAPKIIQARVYWALHAIRSGHSFHSVDSKDLGKFFQCINLDRARVLGNRDQYSILTELLRAFWLHAHAQKLKKEAVPGFSITTDGWLDNYVSSLHVHELRAYLVSVICDFSSRLVVVKTVSFRSKSCFLLCCCNFYPFHLFRSTSLDSPAISWISCLTLAPQFWKSASLTIVKLSTTLPLTSVIE